MIPSLYHATSKRRQKKQSTKHQKQPDSYNPNNQYEEPLEQKKARTVPGKRTCAEATKFNQLLYFSKINI